MNTKNKKYLIWSLISLLTSTFLSLPIFATNIQIEGYVSGGITLTPNGDWNTSIKHNDISHQNYDQTATWASTPLEDYITFIDDTNTPGFHIKMAITDFIYSGNSTTQEPLNGSNLTIYAPYSQNEPTGYNDKNYNINILPESCSSINPANFSPHNDLIDANTNYGLNLKNTDQIILTSDATCLNIGEIRFDRTEILIPAGSSVGNYSATITITIIDGLP